MADQRSDDENATSSTIGRAGPGYAAASARVVALGASVLAAIAAMSGVTSSAGRSIGSAAANVIRWVVSVPVLSLQNVSIRLIASIALWRWASAPSREIRT